MHPWDELTASHWQNHGSMKWTAFPGTLPGFVAEMDFPTAPVITEALHDMVDGELFGYLPPRWKSELKQATAHFVQDQHGWSVPPSRIYPVADVITAYDVVLQSLIPAGSPVIIPTPAYMPFFRITPFRGHPIVEVPMVTGDDAVPRMDLDAIDRAFEEGARLLILCNPHNPLGRVYTRDELESLAAVVSRHGGVVFSDEIHAPLRLGDAPHIPYASLNAETAQHTVTAMSASKAWNLPGLKCAQLVVTSDAHHAVLSPSEFMVSHGVANAGVVATIAAYRHGGPWLDDALSYLRRNISFVTDELHRWLPEARFHAPEGTYIAWIDLRSLDLESHASPQALLADEVKLSLTDGAQCGQAGVGHVRMICATPLPILKEMLERLHEAVTRHSGSTD